MSDTDTAVDARPDTAGDESPAEPAAAQTAPEKPAADSADAKPAGTTVENGTGGGGETRGKHWLRIARKAALPITALIAIAATTAAIILGVQLRDERAIDDASAAALDAAKTYAVTLTSVDSNNLDAGFTAVLDGSTGEFRDMYTRSSGQLRQLLLENKATGKGTVLDAAVKSATETEVDVLLFIDQTVTNAASADPRIDRSRVEMTMQLVDGRWLASRVYLP
ncbi:hypothetical protein [Nocardia asteroides]|uniref:hypothetical protein n=1 Tax=Nocardia asteroides TaxID=1824 RepID=UPI001E5A7843|nr:hypothetical protein [Nocardia asteroides]UGT61288.1 hypothetical protein LTT61_29865 [Nocardia asteroides]